MLLSDILDMSGGYINMEKSLKQKMNLKGGIKMILNESHSSSQFKILEDKPKNVLKRIKMKTPIVTGKQIGRAHV